MPGRSERVPRLGRHSSPPAPTPVPDRSRCRSHLAARSSDVDLAWSSGSRRGAPFFRRCVEPGSPAPPTTPDGRARIERSVMRSMREG
ncbi:MAG: hypothetical protein ACREQ5_40530 [Candidatus Dormibacteria bacterium]